MGARYYPEISGPKRQKLNSKKKNKNEASLGVLNPKNE